MAKIIKMKKLTINIYIFLFMQMMAERKLLVKRSGVLWLQQKLNLGKAKDLSIYKRFPDICNEVFYAKKPDKVTVAEGRDNS